MRSSLQLSSDLTHIWIVSSEINDTEALKSQRRNGMVRPEQNTGQALHIILRASALKTVLLWTLQTSQTEMSLHPLTFAPSRLVFFSKAFYLMHYIYNTDHTIQSLIRFQFVLFLIILYLCGLFSQLDHKLVKAAHFHVSFGTGNI